MVMYRQKGTVNIPLTQLILYLSRVEHWYEVKQLMKIIHKWDEHISYREQ